MTASGFQLAIRQAQDYEALAGVFMGPSARLIVDSMELKSGDTVLDLACGTGLVARQAGNEVGPTGRVVAVDINPAMLAVARETAPDSDIEWVESSADSLPLQDDMFTHVVCQQGLQFFPDASAAVSESRRVLRAGGLFLATIWATPGRNPYIETQLTLLAELEETVTGSAQVATPAHADQLLTALAADAGFGEIGISVLEHTIEIADLRSFFIDQTMSTPWGPVIATLAPQEKTELADTFADRVHANRSDAGGSIVPFCSYMLTARK